MSYRPSTLADDRAHKRSIKARQDLARAVEAEKQRNPNGSTLDTPEGWVNRWAAYRKAITKPATT